MGEAVSGAVTEKSERSRPDIEAIDRGHESLPREACYEAIKIRVEHLPVAQRDGIQCIYCRGIARILWNVAERRDIRHHDVLGTGSRETPGQRGPATRGGRN